ncbi:MAG: hypothetical protein OEL83_04300 [Desulforhopalus sp.]|nr:hypothetical protein [Desulforhopalus sp.]
MQTQAVANVETLKQEIYQLERQTADFNTYEDLKTMLFRVNAVQRIIFEELNRRTAYLLGKTD